MPECINKVTSAEFWVFGDCRSPRLLEYSLRTLARARKLADQVRGRTAMIIPAGKEKTATNDSMPICIPVSDAAQQSIQNAADRVYVLRHPLLEFARPDILSQAMVEIIKQRRPKLMMFALTDLGRELAARTARLLSSGLIADCLDLRLDHGIVTATCPAWGGQIMAEIAFRERDCTGVATVSFHGLKPLALRGDPGAVEQIKLDHLAEPQGLRLIGSEPEPEAHRRLEQAEVVVVGGAGLGDSDNFELARELAAAMRGELGATRPPVLSHWVEEERLIGQTGKTVRPSLLISVGTSGAVQYTAGILDSGTIVAINRDPDAAIFHDADLGVVADAKSFLPILIPKIKAAFMRRLTDMLMKDGTRSEKEKLRGFGAKVAELRIAHGWSRNELARATAQSPEFILELEADKTNPSVSFLLSLARALSVDPSAFLTEEEKGMIKDERTKAFVKRTQNYSYQTLTPGAQNEHLRAFMILIDPLQAHKPVAYKHEGEEFIYVIDGELDLTLGNKNHYLKPGQSIHFNSDTPHKLRSLSEIPTRCLVILYTP